ncbi:hypothetical protein TREMEDRAFT_68589 [Tremella mesenterica DSM 1558]|uniref:uncharacterized protein n=1 Tax=Tremella mesenterica (strain ATCC 24925 / CBS 8224 / DSM 1558 / NBRC 9311 / NRRL Y-6157 / RJB 2259-6 / UBC 559-6) TaxID=578456 RepID=UPI0003F4961A|nr:uncharacterized protein TREMEDRAFT_68589 [Tremella mesenterica DSM 1558]EIW70281.1 hypothetical protein TREMEDRAFT_68589 [Tremella mesenterica DSM 1558]
MAYYSQNGQGYGQGEYGGEYGYEQRGEGGYPQQGEQRYAQYPQEGHQQGYGQYPQQGYEEEYGGREREEYDGREDAAGYTPPGEIQQAYQPPYGQERDYAPQGQGQGQGQYFEYSRCNGKKKALLIGINYIGSDNELKGCINDAHNVERFICERFRYDPSDIVMLTDDSPDPRALPTKENMIRGMEWLCADAQRDDSLFFHYSGHGTQVQDENGDEEDGIDEAICPMDFRDAGLIIDDDSDFQLLVRPLPAGCRLTAIFDSCHSGTVSDLPYVYTTEGKIEDANYLAGAENGLLGAGLAFFRGERSEGVKDLIGIAKSAWNVKQAEQRNRSQNTAPADVIMFSGCLDSQTSADTQEAGRATGAMSYAFIAALTKYPKQSYQQLLCTIREELEGRYSQDPQLSACHPIDTELEFVA